MIEETKSLKLSMNEWTRMAEHALNTCHASLIPAAVLLAFWYTITVGKKQFGEKIMFLLNYVFRYEFILNSFCGVIKYQVQ